MTEKVLHGTITILLLWLACSAPPCAAFAQAAESEKNLVVNSSFEEAVPDSPVPAGWYGMTEVYSLDKGMAKTGRASLKYVNADPQRYVLCTQKVSVRPGWKVRFGVWIKSQDIQGEESGASAVELARSRPQAA